MGPEGEGLGRWDHRGRDLGVGTRRGRGLGRWDQKGKG